MKKITILLPVLIILFSSCSVDNSDSTTSGSLKGVWAEYRGGHERTGFSQSSAPTTIPTNIADDFNSTIGVGADGSPIIANGIIYMSFIDWQGHTSLKAFDLKNGNKIWSYSLEFSSIMPPAISDGILYFASTDEEVIALDANNGSEIWKTSISWQEYSPMSFGSSSPTIYNGVLLVSNVALNSMTGELLWKYDCSLNANPNSVHSTTWSYGPTASNGLVYYSGHEQFANYEQNEFIYAVDVKTGQEVWRQQVQNRDWSRTSLIAFSDNKLYFTTNESHNHYRYALNASTGEIVWKIEADGRTNQESCPAVGYGMVFINSYHGLYAVDQDTGQELWRFGESGTTMQSNNPTVADNKVFIISWDYVHALDVNSGNEVWKYDGVYGSSHWEQELVVLEGRIYFNNGYGVSILE